MPIGLPVFADSRPFLLDSPPRDRPVAVPFLICGVLYDRSSSFRAGSRHAPYVIRAASYNFETYSPSRDMDMKDIPVYDCGNVFEVGNIHQVRSELLEIFSAAGRWDPRFIPIVIGGDHSVSPAAAAALEETFKETGRWGSDGGPGIIVLDAHMDYRDTYLGDPDSHACTLRRFAEIAGTKKIVSMGVRSLDAGEMEDAYDDGIRFFTTEEIIRNGPGKILSEALAYLDTDSIYLSLDMDFIDPSFAPGVGTPEHIGLTPRDVIHIIEALGSRMIGLDITEVCPPCDAGDITSILAAKLIREAIFSKAAQAKPAIQNRTAPGEGAAGDPEQQGDSGDEGSSNSV